MSHYQYVPARTNHILHFVMSCLTLGLWLPVWFVATLHNHNRTVTKRLPVAPRPPVWGQPGWEQAPLAPPQYPAGYYPPPPPPIPAPYMEGDRGWGG